MLYEDVDDEVEKAMNTSIEESDCIIMVIVENFGDMHKIEESSEKENCVNTLEAQNTKFLAHLSML